jgi:predicted phosphodiesterase
MDERRGPDIAPADAATSTPDPAAKPAPDGEVTEAEPDGDETEAETDGRAAEAEPDDASPAAAGRARRVRGALAARLDRHRHRGPGLRRALFALLGAGLAVALFGRVPAKVGPFETTMSARPSLNGHTVVQLAPLGTIDLDTHDWPLAITLRVDQIGVADAERLAGNPAAIDRLGDEAADEVRSALMGLVVRCTLVALAGGVAGALAARLSWRSVVVGAAVAGLLVVALGAGAAATFDERAVSEPRYTGLLTRAPTAVGDIEAVIDRFGEYRTQLSELVDNMATLYLAGAELPTFQPDGELIRVLHVSDIHLNPQAFDLIERLTEQFGVDVVADTGDLTDWGTRPEARLVDRIGDLEVPYVYVRGNHDSHSIQAAVTDQPNAVVLDGEATTVAGLRFWGIGDPRYTPDKSVQGEGTEQERALAFAPEAADELADDEPPDVDVAMVHDERVAADLGGEVPLVLAGHTHNADEGRIEPRDDDADGAEDGGTEDGDGEDGDGEDGGGEDGDGEDGGSASTDDSETTDTADATDEDGTGDEAGGADEDEPAETLLLVEGSTGGAGLRGLQGEEPEPLAASILYFDPETRELVAYDRITVAWLQDAGATIERHIIGDIPEDDEADDTGGTGGTTDTADTDTDTNTGDRGDTG